MKKSLVFLFLLSFASIAFGQTLVNPSFEDWTSFSASGGVGEYPTGWTTTDSTTMASGGVQSVWRGTDPFAGLASLHLKSALIVYSGINVAGPAVATNGIIAIKQVGLSASYDYSGGTADTSRARYYSGQYKYSPDITSTDSGLVNVYLLKWNGASRDTIAAGSVSLDSSTSYRQFMVTMNYRDFINQPDTSLIIIQSAKGGLVLFATSVPNTELTIDSLNATGFVGVEELTGDVKSFTAYPSPAASFITLDAELRNQTSLSYDIFDSNGRWIRAAIMKTSKETIDISDLSVGNYVVKLNGNGKTMTAERFSVLR